MRIEIKAILFLRPHSPHPIVAGHTVTILQIVVVVV
jgi:hypothetical protein